MATDPPVTTDPEPPEPPELPEPPHLPLVRYHDLDALRAFAMLLGILVHAVLSFNNTPIWPAQDKFQDPDFQIINNFIHGFRMQLFFLVSGFFACMMWLKRGSFGLIWHRCKRILLPLLVFSLFIIPALTNMPKLAKQKARATQEASRSEAGKPARASTASIWDAAKEGDLLRIQKLIDGGANINRPKPGLVRATALHHASAAGETEVVSFLLNAGAKIDAVDGEGASALHWAALMGQAAVTEILLEAGASPQQENQDKETPLKAAQTPKDQTQMAIWFLKMPVSVEEVMAGRAQVRALLTGEKPGLWTKLGSFFERNYMSEFFGSKIVLHHLWFLYDLFLLCLGFALLIGLFRLLLRAVTAFISICVKRKDAGSCWNRWKPLSRRAVATGLGAFAFLLIFETYRGQDEMGTAEFGPQTAVFVNAEPLPPLRVVSDDVIRTLRRKGLTEEALSALREAGISERAIDDARRMAADTGGRLKKAAAEELGSSNRLGLHVEELREHLMGLPAHLRQKEDKTWRSGPQYLADNTLIARVPLENIAFPPQPAWWKLWHYGVYFLVGAILFQFRSILNLLRFAWPVLFALAAATFVLSLAETRKELPEFINLFVSLSSALGNLAGHFVEWFNGADGQSAKARGWTMTKAGFLLTTYSWLMIFGFIGLFKLICSKPRGWIRFTSNSSYWLYLAHMPLVDVLQIWVSDWGAGSTYWTEDNQWILIFMKLGFVCLLSTALLLGSYFLVQYTHVSNLLNGRRKRIFREKEVRAENPAVRSTTEDNYA